MASKLKQAVSSILADVESAKRHWAQVLDVAGRFAPEPDDTSRWAFRTEHEAKIARAALEYMELTGRVPGDLTFGATAEACGLELESYNEWKAKKVLP